MGAERVDRRRAHSELPRSIGNREQTILDREIEYDITARSVAQSPGRRRRSMASPSVIDAGSGALLSTLSAGSGVDVISYSPELRHLYVPGSDSATMAVLAVSAAGKLALLGTVGTTRGSHCVVADDRARAWICDQDRGQLLLYTDALPVP